MDMQTLKTGQWHWRYLLLQWARKRRLSSLNECALTFPLQHHQIVPLLIKLTKKQLHLLHMALDDILQINLNLVSK